MAAYFPLFISLQRRKCLLVGAGAVAERRFKVLQSFGAQLTVVAPQIAPFFAQGNCVLQQRKFSFADLDDMDLVIAATDDRLLNQSIVEACGARKIWVNSVHCESHLSSAYYFTFPAIARHQDLTVGIVSGERKPRWSQKVRRYLELYFSREDGE